MVTPFATAETIVTVAGRDWNLKTLADRQQFHDPDGEFEAAGVAPAYWSLFGVTWEAGMMLAELAETIDINGKHILEIGSGLGIPSMILKRRGADITASDVHPLAAEFFRENCHRNDVPETPYVVLDWNDNSPIGEFDLIIASDVLYEASHIEPLALFIDVHCKRDFILTDPGRGQVNAFSRRLTESGFTVELERHGKARVARYQRST